MIRYFYCCGYISCSVGCYVLPFSPLDYIFSSSLLYVLCLYLFFVFFFFKQKTAYEMRISDWSSDVCSSDLGGEELLFFGRIHPDKGAAEAIAAARATVHRLTMAGIVQDQAYHDRHVLPFLDGESVRHIGMVGGAARAATLGNARALLHLINFDEPFGLSVVEALACGTPVIAFRRGSMPELIEDGVTGFLVDTLDQAVAAIGQIDRLDRRACRVAAVKRFSIRRSEEHTSELQSLIRTPYAVF